MAKAELIQVSEKTKQSMEILSAFKAQVDEISSNCLLISIVDESSLSVGQQNLSKANTMLKAIEDKVKLIRKPLNDELKQISAIGAPLTESLEKAVNHLKSQVASWEKKRLEEEAAKKAEIDRQLAEKAKAEAAEQKRKDDIRTYINEKAVAVLKKMYEDCVSVEACDNKLQSIEKNYKPREFFAEFADEAYSIKDNYISLIKAKREQLASVSVMSEAEKELALEKERIAIEKNNMALREAELKSKEEANRIEKERKEAEAAAVLEKEKLDAQAALNKTKGIRFTWGCELYDMSNVPAEWLILDEAKVKEWRKDNEDLVKDGEVIKGVRFFKRMGVAS
jgi:hypothetical protein